MAFTNSPLVSYTKLSPNYSKRTAKIDTITPHCVVGHLSLQTLGNVFANPDYKASSNYGIDDEGKVALFVEEKNRSWASANAPNDHRAVTIEVASDKTSPYKVTNEAFEGLIKLAADVCKRNDIPKLMWQANKNLIGKVDQQNVTVHRWFRPRECPGNYIYGKLDEFVQEVNKILIPVAPPKPTTQTGVPYEVKVNASILFYRKGPGVNYPILGQIQKNEVYTIVQEGFGRGASKWGKLKSGKGWIALDYTLRK